MQVHVCENPTNRRWNEEMEWLASGKTRTVESSSNLNMSHNASRHGPRDGLMRVMHVVPHLSSELCRGKLLALAQRRISDEEGGQCRCGEDFPRLATHPP